MTNHDDNDDGLESTRPLTRRERRGLERLGEVQAERREAAQRQAAERRRAAEEARLRAQRAEAARIEAERREAERMAAERLAAQRRAAEPRFPEVRSASDGVVAEDALETPEPLSTTGGQRALGAALNRSRPRGHAALVLVCLAVAAIIIIPLVLSTVNGKSPASRAVASPTGAAMLPADTPLDQAMTVSGRVGATPVVKLTAPLSAPSSLIIDTLITGEGRALQPGDAALLSIATFSGTDGRNTTSLSAGSSGEEHTSRRLVSVSVDQASLNDLTDIITGTTEGTRLVLRGPVVVDGTPSTEITVIDVLPTTASGTAVAPVAGMPTVIPGDAGAVTLSVTGLPAPTRSTAVILIQGTGEQVHSNSRIIARVQAVSWTDGSVITNDYGATALPVAVELSSAKTYAGLRNHLVDVPVGSRVVLALPADQARGDRPVAVVVDVLAIEEPKTEASGASPGATPTVGTDPELSSRAPSPAAPAATAGN
ncbi:hypothetical protein [Actinomyces gaoshouyii]|uniref:Peptidylprolyl isomerase n=1 Tax=Actinomyces gaoshouyii TaxID=1960083 RepID=A0A8H9HDX0_9ACTO|nr:hypothetical protein [Actinomyces gaoshouyii]GGO97608.1 hypothetical protein GCM10011612_10540 [Actinomyces gaoshouyii]